MITDRQILIDGLNTYYRIAGDENKPPLIFLHGWGSRIDSFGPYHGTTEVIEEFAKHFYVLAPELPGLLRSDAPKEVWNYEQFAEVVYEIAKILDWGKSIVLGISFGGGVATAFAKLYPDYTKVLVVVDSVVSNRPRNSYLKFLYAWARLRTKLFPSPCVPKFIKKILIYLYFGTPFKFIDDKNIKDKIILSDIDLKRDLSVDYKQLKMPIVLVWGNKDTWVTPISRAKEIHQEVAGSKLITVKGGHSALAIRPEYVIGEIIKNLPPSLKS